MLMCTMLHRLAGTLLQQCRMNNVQWKQRARLITGLGTAVMIFILLCTVACGGGGDGSLAKGGMNMIIVSGQARIQSGGGNTSVVKDHEAVITTGDQIMAAADGAGVKLLLVDGSLLDLKPDTDLQVVTFSAEGKAKLRQLKGRLEVQAASPLLTIEVSTSDYEGSAFKTMQFTATPNVRETAFGLWIDGFNAHLTVEAGEVNVTNDDGTETISAGSEVKVTSQGVSPTEAPVGPTPVVVPTDDLDPTPTATATATATPTPEPLFPPGLVGPGDESVFNVNETILLMWDTPTPLAEDEWYEVELWRAGEEPPKVVAWVQEGTWKVERKYCSSRCQWRIRIVRGQEGQKEMNLSPPSQTWSFSWHSPVVQAPTAPTSTPDTVATVDLTVYLRGTNNEQRVATFSGEHVDAGTIYTEGGYVYGNVAVRIGDTVYHSDEELASEPRPLPAPYRLEFKFSESLVAATDGKPGDDPQKAQFWVGTLNCNSAVSEPYRIEMTLYAGGEARKHTEISFRVADDPLCGVEEPCPCCTPRPPCSRP